MAGSPEVWLQLRASRSGGMGPGGHLIPFEGMGVAPMLPLLLEAVQLTRKMEMVTFY